MLAVLCMHGCNLSCLFYAYADNSVIPRASFLTPQQENYDIQPCSSHRHQYPLNTTTTTFMRTPEFIAKKHCIVNVHVSYQMSFIWAIIASMFPQSMHSHRLSHYMKYKDFLNTDGLSFPIEPSCVSEFEKLNSGISVNVLPYQRHSIPCMCLHIVSVHIMLTFYCYRTRIGMLSITRGLEICHVCSVTGRYTETEYTYVMAANMHLLSKNISHHISHTVPHLQICIPD